MTSEPAADRTSTQDQTANETASEITHVRSLLAAADRRLLGDTIALSDDDWRAPSRLPGWTRGHVATHLARHAEAFARLASWARTGVEQPMYPTDRDAAIEAGAGRNGLTIQTDLDTATGLLDKEFDAVTDTAAWARPVRLRDRQGLPAARLPAGRLAEVIIHHVDLDVGVAVADLDQPMAEVALGWCAFRVAPRPGFPRLRLTTGCGRAYDLGPQAGGDVVEVGGPANLLLGWITGRSGTDGLEGNVPELPSFG